MFIRKALNNNKVMTSLELLQEIDAWLSFNNSPSKEQISELRKDIKKHISEQLNIPLVVCLVRLN